MIELSLIISMRVSPMAIILQEHLRLRLYLRGFASIIANHISQADCFLICVPPPGSPSAIFTSV